jgi:hypothetical protein
MSGDSLQNPYAPPPMNVAFAPSAKPSRPAWLIVICVMAIALGGFGLLNGAIGVAGVAFQKQLQNAFAPRAQAGLPPELQKAQQEYTQRTQDLQAQYAIPLGAAASARMGIGLGLVIGGIWCLGGKPNGREMFMLALAAAIVFEIANGILQVIFSMQMIGMTNEFFQKFVDNMPNQRGPGPEMMLSIMHGVMWLGIGLGLLWDLVKLGFYFGGLLYLRRSAIAALFAPATHSSPPQPD